VIHEIEVRNFQSLHHVTLEPGRFTVVVGPSNVGKSAFMRALRTLTSNRRGTEFISHGERISSIKVRTDRGTVTLTRGVAATDNTYTVTPEDPGHPLAPERIFRKLGGDVPPEVSEFLGIEAKDPINYAGQFDKPYLLDDSAGEVARVLGSLTNVNVIFEAARESNRRRLAYAQTLKTRSEDLAAINARVPGFRALKAKAQAVTRAEEHLAIATRLERDIARLTEAVEQAEIAERTIERLAPIAEREIPSAEAIISAHDAITAYTGAIREQSSARAALTAATEALEQAQQRLEAIEAEYEELVGSIRDSLAGWFGVVAEKYEHEGITYVTLDEAVRVAALYIEEQAKRDSE